MSYLKNDQPLSLNLLLLNMLTSTDMRMHSVSTNVRGTL